MSVQTVKHRGRALAPAAVGVFAISFSISAAAQQLAFPSAEGFGRFATGARGGAVYHVTNLDDAGPGSFRDAVSQPNRTVVFDVGGLIRLGERFAIAPNTYIAGQTAPGDGIVIYGNGLSFSNSNNAIVRYIRVRMGKVGSSGKDAITIAEGNNMIFDHVSVSWGRDENFSINGPVSNVTIQNSIIAQGLDTHSCGGLIQTDGGVSILRSLYIDNHTRNAKVKGVNQFVNNVVYDWREAGYILGDSAGLSYANVTDNYFIEGPEIAKPPFTRGNENFHIYASGNYHDASKDGVLNGNVLTEAEYGVVTWVGTPFDYPVVSPMTAQQAYQNVVSSAGASLRRDEVDRYVIDELTSLGAQGAIISDETLLPTGGPGTVNGGPAPIDTDQDGMPDQWEQQHSFNSGDPEDRNGDADGDGYTNLEEYLQALLGEGDGP
jgi:pectate lyase